MELAKQSTITCPTCGRKVSVNQDGTVRKNGHTEGCSFAGRKIQLVALVTAR